MPIKPLFSIIIPTYNSEKTLSRTLDSIVIQSFKDYEILIIDGLSTDKTLFIVEEYQLKHPVIRVYSESDSGIYDAMNKGIALSKGKWLYFIGGDDLLFDNEVLKKIADEIFDTSYNVIYGDVYYALKKCIYNGRFDYANLIYKNICHQSIFVERWVFNKIGNFDKSYKSVADWHHNIRWFYNGNIRHKYVKLTIAEYSDGGYSSLNKDRKFLDNKNEIFLKYGIHKLPINNLIGLTSNIVKKHKNKKQFFKFFIYGGLLFALKLRRKILNN